MENNAGVRIVAVPATKFVTSGPGTFGDANIDQFDAWLSAQPQRLTPRDFMWFDPEARKLVWNYCPDFDTVAEGFGTLDFAGGLYAVAISRDEDDNDGERVYNAIKQWVRSSGCFELDERPNHYTMFHVVTPPEARKALGFSQLDIYVPIKVKDKTGDKK